MGKGLVVSNVLEGSIAEEMEIEPGDKVLAVDEQEIEDIIDFEYLTAEDNYQLLIEKPDGELWELEIERFPGEVMGLEVEKVSAGGIKNCRNNCVFCFVAQLPKGMRSTLYEKDDDYRLSLTQGSFITLSNLSDEEFERILKYHLSPLYISIHAWDPEVRVKLMKNPHAGSLPSQLTRLAEAGITIHTQIVLVPGYNDGEVLKETVQQLGRFFPSVQSIAVVPVGLTKHREKLAQLRGFYPEEAKEILEIGRTWQKEFQERTGKNLIYFSDEFYVSAGKPFPEAESYDGFPQLENGIGMTARFIAEVDETWNYLPQELPGRRVHIITGASAKHFFQDMTDRLESRVKGLSIQVHSIKNNYFGESVTVAGLLTAQDIAEQVKDLGGEEFLIPDVMLKRDEELFLDDHDLAWLEAKLNGAARIVENSGYDLIAKVMNPREVK